MGVPAITIARAVFHGNRHVAHRKWIIGYIGETEIQHGHRAVLIERRGADLEDPALQFDVGAALHVEDSADHRGDHKYGDSQRDQQ